MSAILACRLIYDDPFDMTIYTSQSFRCNPRRDIDFLFAHFKVAKWWLHFKIHFARCCLTYIARCLVLSS